MTSDSYHVADLYEEDPLDWSAWVFIWVWFLAGVFCMAFWGGAAILVWRLV